MQDVLTYDSVVFFPVQSLVISRADTKAKESSMEKRHHVDCAAEKRSFFVDVLTRKTNTDNRHRDKLLSFSLLRNRPLQSAIGGATAGGSDVGGAESVNSPVDRVEQSDVRRQRATSSTGEQGQGRTQVAVGQLPPQE